MLSNWSAPNGWSQSNRDSIVSLAFNTLGSAGSRQFLRSAAKWSYELAARKLKNMKGLKDAKSAGKRAERMAEIGSMPIGPLLQDGGFYSMKKQKRKKAARVSMGNIAGPHNSPITTVRRREQIDTIYSPGSVGERVFNYSVSPENFNTFPWLSQIARNWTQYRFRNLRFEYVPIVGQFSSTGQVGSLIMGFDPDTTNEVTGLLANRTQILGLETSREVRLDKINSLKCNQGRLLNWYDVGNIDVTSEQFSDLGTLYVDVSGTAVLVGQSVGDLFVEYTVDLSIPRINYLGSSSSFSHIYNVSQTSNASIRLSNAGLVLAPGGTLRYSTDYVIAGSGNGFTVFQPGKWYVVISWLAVTGPTTTPTLSLGAGCTSLPLFQALASNQMTTFAQVAGTACLINAFQYDQTVAPTGGSCTLSGLATMNTANYDFFIFSLPPGATTADPSETDILKMLCRKMKIRYPTVPRPRILENQVTSSSSSVSDDRELEIV